jgi:SAM-dependent methyltransferase
VLIPFRIGLRFVALCCAVLATLAGCATLGDETGSAQVAFITTPRAVVTRMLQLANVTGDDVVYDLGSGDGRIVIAAAREFGARGVGVEIDPDLIRESEENARAAGVEGRVRFIQKDLFQVDLHEATVVTLFLLPGVNELLAPKFLRELKPGTPVVSHMFDMGEWQPDKTIKVQSSILYVWLVPADVAGTWHLTVPTAQALGSLGLSLRQAYQGLRGAARLNEKRVDVREPRIEGAQLAFVVSGTIDGKAMEMSFSGTVHGNEAAGKVEIQGGPHAGTHEWKARRTQ